MISASLIDTVDGEIECFSVRITKLTLGLVTCMDPRCEPTQFLGEEAGRFATVKNAGGRATLDAVRSILVLRSLNTVSDGGTVAVVHHTGKYHCSHG